MQKLLFTGASGFLGNNVLPLLKEKYDVKTMGLENGCDYVVNMAYEIPELIENFDVVLHAAGKAHTVPRTEAEEQVFYDVNLNGTIHLCDALEKIGAPKSLIFISTVAVYGCETGENISEDHPLEGNTPYADSKKKAEEYLTEWCSKNNVKLGIIRPSLLAGPNPPGNLGAMINGIKSHRYLSIGGGKARKSVLMVQDIGHLVPLLAQHGGIYNVCDNEQPTFRELDRVISSQLKMNMPLSIPYWMAKCMAFIGDCLGKKVPINSLKLDKITKSLTFSNEKAKKTLGWTPTPVIENFKIS